MLLETMTADEAIRHGVTVKDYRTDEEKAQPLDVSQWQLSPWAKWVAADADGTVWEFDKKVTERLFAWIILDDIGKASYVGHINMAGIDWRRTLTAVNVEPARGILPGLTGIDWRQTLTPVPAQHSDFMQAHIATEVAVIDAQPQTWCARCNLPDDICRGHDADDLAAALLALDAMQELDLASALVRADVVRAEGFHMALGMALDVVTNPRYIGDAERHARIWDKLAPFLQEDDMAQLRVAQ